MERAPFHEELLAAAEDYRPVQGLPLNTHWSSYAIAVPPATLREDDIAICYNIGPRYKTFFFGLAHFAVASVFERLEDLEFSVSVDDMLKAANVTRDSFARRYQQLESYASRSPWLKTTQRIEQALADDRRDDGWRMQMPGLHDVHAFEGYDHYWVVVIDHESEAVPTAHLLPDGEPLDLSGFSRADQLRQAAVDLLFIPFQHVPLPVRLARADVCLHRAFALGGMLECRKALTVAEQEDRSLFACLVEVLRREDLYEQGYLRVHKTKAKDDLEYWAWLMAQLVFQDAAAAVWVP